MRPEDIAPSYSANYVVAACILFFSGVVLMPVGMAIYHDGFGSVVDWPDIFNWFLAAGGSLLALSLWLVFGNWRACAPAEFQENGFTLDVSMFFYRRRVIHISWSDVEEVVTATGHKGNDIVEFILSSSGAVRANLIQKATKTSERKRKVTFPVKLSAIRLDEAFERFKVSAELAGARLLEKSSTNLLVVKRSTWIVDWS